MASRHALHHHQSFDPDGTLISDEVKAKGLYVSRPTIPADGTTERYFGHSVEADSQPTDTTFTINGTLHTLSYSEHPDHPGFWVAEDTLTADTVGTITIEAEGEQIEIEAV